MLKMVYILSRSSKGDLMLSHIYDTLLSLQQALGNCVTPTLRAVTVDIDEKKRKFFFCFYYDRENIYDYELEDLVSVLLVEIDTCTEQGYLQEHELVQLDYPKKIPTHGSFAFLRYELTLPEIKRENRLFLLDENFPHQAIFRLDMQEALLGKVTKTLRHVSVGVDIDKKKLIADFIYDGKISELDYKLATAAIQESRISFPDFEMVSSIERIDFPKDFQCREGNRLAYWRQETIFTKDGSQIPDYLKPRL